MIDRRTVFEIHRLFHEGYGIRKIARTLRLSRDSVKKYLDNPNPAKPMIIRGSKLDPFKEEIQRLLQRDPTVSGSVLYQRLIPQGYAGGISILREYLHKVRPREKQWRVADPKNRQYRQIKSIFVGADGYAVTVTRPSSHPNTSQLQFLTI